MRKISISILCILFFSITSYTQPCTPLGDEVTYGTNDVWIGYAYDNIDFTNYKGYTNEGVVGNPDFDESFGGDDVTYSTNGCSFFTSTFSMRYKLIKNFANGIYVFSVGGDDGYRLSLDGGATWVINNWGDHSYTSTMYSATLNGSYNIVLEYYENGGGNRVSFTVAPACTGTEDQSVYGTGNIWNGYIYDGINFDLYSGMVHEGSAASPNFDESFGGSDVLYATSSCNVQTETFSARYRLRKNFIYGSYVFTVGGDDGYRLSIDGGATWLVDKWNLQSYNTTLSPVVILNGNYDLVVEYFENGGDNRVSFSVQLLTILAVNLSTFNATPNGNEVKLDWTVAAGSTPKQFEIQKSDDAIAFKTITTTAAGNNLQYTATDKNTTPGISYYRLKSTDINGGFYYSNIVAVRITKTDRINNGLFYPSIVTGNTVTFKSETTINNAVITVTDINGRTVSRQGFEKITANTPMLLQLTPVNKKLPSGFYIIKVNSAGGESVTGKIIIQ